MTSSRMIFFWPGLLLCDLDFIVVMDTCTCMHIHMWLLRHACFVARHSLLLYVVSNTIHNI